MRKDARRVKEREEAAREEAILRKAGTLGPGPAPGAAPGIGPATPPGSAYPDGQGKAGTAARRRRARPPAAPRDSRPRATQEQAFSTALVAAIGARTAWDEPPALYTVHRGPGACHLRPLNIRADSWSGRRPHEVILGFALTIPAAPSPAASPDLIGLALRCEAWTLLAKDMTADQRSRTAAGHFFRPSLEPNRAEVRVIYGVDTAGTAYHLQQLRGGKPQLVICPPGGEAAVAGEVPCALRGLLAAMTSRQPGPLAAAGPEQHGPDLELG